MAPDYKTETDVQTRQSSGTDLNVTYMPFILWDFVVS